MSWYKEYRSQWKEIIETVAREYPADNLILPLRQEVYYELQNIGEVVDLSDIKVDFSSYF